MLNCPTFGVHFSSEYKEEGESAIRLALLRYKVLKFRFYRLFCIRDILKIVDVATIVNQ